jgi:hypothetical protein
MTLNVERISYVVNDRRVSFASGPRQFASNLGGVCCVESRSHGSRPVQVRPATQLLLWAVYGSFHVRISQRIW